MNQITDRIDVNGLSFAFNRHGGNIADFSVRTDSGDDIHPLHEASWVGDPNALPDTVDRVERQLAGDFFCAPFGNAGGSPIHGWTANGHWMVDKIKEADSGRKTASYNLEQTVLGAHVTKHLTAVPGHPILYQMHRFTGGEGHLPVAHHAMIKVPGGARLSFSAKQFGRTPMVALETEPTRGHSMLAYPQQFKALETVQTGTGESVDARTYPFADKHEDIVVLAEESGSRLGWSAALAVADGFIFFAIKDAQVLPETLLWMSNGGRSYAPWSGRHSHVLGIEEAATSCHDTGEFGSEASHSTHGLPRGIVLSPTKSTDIRYCFGAIAAPAHWREIVDIQIATSALTVVDVGGDSQTVPFDRAHFGLQPSSLL